MSEIATDIRTAGELVEVLSKLPEHTPVKVDGDWGYSHYLTVDVVDGEVYLEVNQDRVVRRVWMNGEDKWVHRQWDTHQTLCRLRMGGLTCSSESGTEVTCPWCLYNMNRRHTMMNFSPPPAPYGKET